MTTQPRIESARCATRKMVAGLGSLALTFFTAIPAFAQLEEVVVTVRKREESVQNIPVAGHDETDYFQFPGRDKDQAHR